MCDSTHSITGYEQNSSLLVPRVTKGVRPRQNRLLKAGLLAGAGCGGWCRMLILDSSHLDSRVQPSLPANLTN